MKNAVITASVVLHLANRDEMLPRFAADEMPAVPAGRGGGGGRVRRAGPVAQPHIYALAKGKPLTVRAPRPRRPAARGRARAHAPATAAVATQPAHGKVALKPDGSFVYTPSASFTGTTRSPTR